MEYLPPFSLPTQVLSPCVSNLNLHIDLALFALWRYTLNLCALQSVLYSVSFTLLFNALFNFLIFHSSVFYPMITRNPINEKFPFWIFSLSIFLYQVLITKRDQESRLSLSTFMWFNGPNLQKLLMWAPITLHTYKLTYTITCLVCTESNTK